VLINLINLDRTPDRLAQFRAANAHLTNVVRFAAIDGLELDVGDLVARGLVKKTATNFERGSLGCSMSHRALWDRAIESGEAVTVCEDDAILHHRFESLAPKVMAALPADWDFVLWGWNFDTAINFELLPGISRCQAHLDQNGLRAGADLFQAQPILPRTFRLRSAFGTPCYTISPKGAQALRAFCFPLRLMRVFVPALNREIPNYQIDVTMNIAYNDIQAHICLPPLAITKNESARSTTRPRPESPDAESRSATPSNGLDRQIEGSGRA
jgi:glycosyl transferase, family 25